MLGFCFSGSFIDELSKPNRIIISSAGPDEFSYKGPLARGDNIREGEFFISEFFKSVARGKNIKASFSEAVIQTEIFTAKGEGSVNAPPYFDNSAQHPLLDDNGDKKGSNNVNDTSTDGHLAEQIIIGVSSLTMNNPGDVTIKDVSDAIFLETDEIRTNEIWAEVSNSDRVLPLWLEIKPPDFVPNEVGTGQVVMDLKKVVTINNNKNVYHWDSSEFDYKFDKPGTYHIYYFAKDFYSKNISPMKESIVYKASAVNDPPEPFNLVSPSNDVTITSLGVLSSFAADPTAGAYTIISWEKTTDPDKNDRISYTLLLKKNNNDFDNPENIIKYPNLTNNFHEINLPGDDWDGSTVYWKVQAIDNYGKIRNSETNHFYVNNANNPSNGTLWGYVFDENTKEAIPVMATINVSAGGKLVKQITSSKEDGLYFEAFKPLNNYKIEVQKEGYVTEVRTFVNVPADEKCQQNFYLKRDNSSSLLISSIPPQTINEGETFAPISLDTYISVMNVDKDQINWTVSGHKNLIITIDNNRKAIILPNDENWHGAEEITFYAEAPDHNKVSTSVEFTVRPVNDPPKIFDIPDQTIFDSSKFQTIELDQYIQDIDNAYTEITWSAKGQQNLSVSIANRLATISVSDTSWIGYEDITFIAKDPSGESDEKSVRFAVVGKSEPVISLNHPKVVHVNQNEEFIEPGYVAMDDIDGDITESVIVQSDVDTQTPGIYRVTYHATDSTGNISDPTDRIVIVNKNQFPTQKISGNIIDESNAPVGGVDIVITGQGHTYETTSHYHGSFELLIPITFDGSLWQMSLTREDFYAKTLEFSEPPSFETITLFSKDSNNAAVINGQCFSYTVDGTPDALPQVTIRARSTDDDTVIATSISDSDGQYTLAVDVRDRTYRLEALKYGYETQSFDTSSASNITLIPLTKIIIEQPENMADHNTARNMNKVTIFVSAEPPFSDKTNELIVNLTTESSKTLTIEMDYIENDHKYKLEYPKYEDFTINLQADTTEDQDAKSGYFVEQTFSFKSIEKTAQLVVTKDETDYLITEPFYVEQPGLSSFMMIDRGGLSGLDIPKKLNYTIRDYTFPLNEDLCDHVVEFVLKDSFGQEIKIIDNSICLGIGFEPPVSRENLMNQTYELIHSETVADLLKGQGQAESSFSIFEKHVTFCTSHLSAYGFRKKGEQGQQLQESSSGDDSGGCFLKSILNWDDN